jgi:nucleoid-associated protein YgaU
MAEDKGLFAKLFGKKESKEELEEAARKAEAEAKAKEVAEENDKRVEQAERYKAEAEARQAEYETRRAAEKAAAFIGEHTVTSEDTLSHIALKFYGKATPPYYKLIYEANKDIIGDNMNIIVPGQVLRIPALPEELK